MDTINPKGGSFLLTRIKHLLDRTVDWSCIIAVAAIVVIAFFQVISRYVMAEIPSWTEEACRYVSIWLVFLGSAVAFRKGAHLGVDFLVNLFPSPLRKAASLFASFVLIFILSLTVLYSWKMMLFNVTQLSPAMRISMAIPYAAIPIGTFLMLIEVLWSLPNIFIMERGDN